MTDIAPVKSIGVPHPMVDGPEKVTGNARFSADFTEGKALEGRILRSTRSHALVKSIDISKAARLPGVSAVITGDACDRTHGVLPIAMLEYPIARDRVRYRGEPVAAVAAVDA